MRYGRALPTVAGALGVTVSLLVGGGVAHAASLQHENFVAVAHRGASGAAPEHTMAAYEQASQYAPDRFEMDIQLSKDGVPVLMHDRTLRRTTNVEKVFPKRADSGVGNFKYDELRELDAGSWFDSQFSDEQIPRLSEVVSFAGSRGIGLFLELKYPDDSPGLEKAAVRELRAVPEGQQMLASRQVTFLSFEADSLHRMDDQLADPDLMWLGTSVPGKEKLGELSSWADWVGVDHRELDEKSAERARNAGLELGAYTVNGADNMCRSAGLGVDAITSNEPDDLVAMRNGERSCS